MSEITFTPIITDQINKVCVKMSSSGNGALISIYRERVR